jgi:DNA-binding NarL/FixJ family response regulator
LGYDNRQIGQSLCIAEQTVKNHLYTIFGKAGVSRRRDLVRHEYVRDDVERDLDSDFPTEEATDISARRATGD